MLGGQGTLGVGMSIQNKLLGDKPEGFFDGLNLDLMPISILVFPHGNSKGEEPVSEDVRWKNGAWGVMMEPPVRFPHLPVALPVQPIHCCRSNCFPCSISKTLNLSHQGKASRVHNWLPGNRNMVSNEEQKSRSVRVCAEQNNFWAFEGRDAMLAITFLMPGTWTVVSRPVWVQYNMKARLRKRRLAVADLAFEAILSIQLTVGVLLHGVPSGVCLGLLIRSHATSTARTSAASSKSKFVSWLYRVSSDTPSVALSAGNSLRHTTGGVLLQSKNQTPPAPSATAS